MCQLKAGGTKKYQTPSHPMITVTMEGQRPQYQAEKATATHKV